MQFIYNDITLSILLLITKLYQSESCARMLETMEPPTFNRKNINFMPTLFHKTTLSHEGLILRAKFIIMDYIYDDKKPSDKGHNRASSFIMIFKNMKLSTSCKMMALYALMTEDTQYENRLKTCLEQDFKLNLFEIQNAAEKYAKDNNQDLQVIKNNLINRIHEKYFDHYWSFATDDELLSSIKNDNKNEKQQNCMVM